MKALVILLSLVSSSVFADVSPLGHGMYCAPTAEQAARQDAIQRGASLRDVNASRTGVIEPDQGAIYKTTIGNLVYYTFTVAQDGDCSVEFQKVIESN